MILPYIYSLWLVLWGTVTAREIEPHPDQAYARPKKSEGGQTCRFRQVEECGHVDRFSGLPDRGEDVLVEYAAVGKQKEPVAAIQPRTGIDERFDARGARGHREHPEPMDTEFALVNFLRPGGFVCEEFSVKGRLAEALADHRHGAAVGFEEVIYPLWFSIRMREFQGKDPIGDDAELFPVTQAYFPLKRLMLRRKAKLVFVEEANAGMRSARQFDGGHDIGDKDRMFKEKLSDRAIGLTP